MFIHLSPILSPQDLLRALFKNHTHNISKANYFSSSRAALLAAVHSIKEHYKLKNYPKIWAPAFICASVTNLFEIYGVPFEFYHVKEDLVPDWDYLENQSFRENDIFLLVHYFGFSFASDRSQAFCQKHKLILIDDCAHFLAEDLSKMLGEAQIFGIRKILPVPDGGILYMKDIPVVMPQNLPNQKSIHRSILKMLLQWFLQKTGIGWKITKDLADKMSQKGEENGFYAIKKMGFWTRCILDSINIEKIIEKRRNNYKAIFLALKELNIPKTLDHNARGAIPWHFFFYHKDSVRIIKALNKKKILASFWPTLPKEVLNDTKWSLEKRMFMQSVTLPVHQDIGEKELSYIIEQVKSNV